MQHLEGEPTDTVHVFIFFKSALKFKSVDALTGSHIIFGMNNDFFFQIFDNFYFVCLNIFVNCEFVWVPMFFNLQFMICFQFLIHFI